jgi:hypothetical protein
MTSVKVLTADNVVVEIDKSILHFFTTIQDMIADIGEVGDLALPLPNVEYAHLKIMIDWAMHHAETKMPECLDAKPTFNEKGERTREFGTRKLGHFKVGILRESEHLIDPWNMEFIEKLGSTYQERFNVLDSLFPATNYLGFRHFYEFISQAVYRILKVAVEEKCYKPEGSNMSTRECDDLARAMFQKFAPRMFVDDMTEEQKASLTDPVGIYDRSTFAPKSGFDGQFKRDD